MRTTITKLTRAAFTLALIVAIASALGAVAFAHGGFEHVIGTVTKVSATSVTIETRDKKMVEVGLTPKTTYTRDTKPVAASDMKVGDRVVIDATEVNEKLVAASAKLGATAAPAHADHDHAAPTATK